LPSPGNPDTAPSSNVATATEVCHAIRHHAGPAVQRHRDDAICNAFSGTIIALVMTPINSFSLPHRRPPSPKNRKPT
jgi:hypothetical protein